MSRLLRTLHIPSAVALRCAATLCCVSLCSRLYKRRSEWVIIVQHVGKILTYNLMSSLSFILFILNAEGDVSHVVRTTLSRSYTKVNWTARRTARQCS